MLFEIAEHVHPTYPLMETPPPHPDHLHEAMQRIILNYLVAHRDNDIPLDPDNLRRTEGPPEPVEPLKASTSKSNKRPREFETTDQRPPKRLMASKEHSLPAEATTGYPYRFGPRA